jgi:hypothetical protein
MSYVAHASRAVARAILDAEHAGARRLAQSVPLDERQPIEGSVDGAQPVDVDTVAHVPDANGRSAKRALGGPSAAPREPVEDTPL